MANEIAWPHTTAANLYVVLRNSVNQVYNGSIFVAYNTSNIGDYDIPMTEQGTASGFYVASMPSVAAGVYGVVVYLRAGGSPAEGDRPLSTGEIEWSGTAETYASGDAFARIGAPAGASLSADTAAVKAQTAAIETDTQDIQGRIPAALTGAGNIKADVEEVNETSLQGVGTSGNPWRPA